MSALPSNPPARQLEKIGLRFLLLQPGRWNQSFFAGVCAGSGCPYAMAFKIAADLGAGGERLATLRPLYNMEHFRAACEMVGVRVEEIPPL